MPENHSHGQQTHIDCPVNCPNRKTNVGKGYSVLFSATLTLLLAWHSVSIKYDRTKGLEFQTKDIPVGLLIGYSFLVCGALGINTDPLAQWLGRVISQGKNIG